MFKVKKIISAISFNIGNLKVLLDKESFLESSKYSSESKYFLEVSIKLIKELPVNP